MQDLTKGSVSAHLLKTASFMLVTMVFQTLYFLVDLYWVGRLGKEAVAGVGVAGNLTFIVLAVSQMLGVGHDHARLARGGSAQHGARAARLQPVAGALDGRRRALFLVSMVLRVGYANALSADPRPAALAADYLLWFLPAMGLQFCLVAMSAALRGIGQLQARNGRADGDGHRSTSCSRRS